MSAPARLTAILLLGAAVSLPTSARAEADPVLGYMFSSFAAGFHLGVATERPSLFSGEWTSSSTFEGRARPWGLEGAGFGVGVGYAGLNGQLEVRSAADVSAALLTIGYRYNLQISNVELWTRVALGPAMTIGYRSPSVRRDPSGGIVTVAEVGADYFFWQDTLAIGVKAVGSPGYAWPARFSADFDLTLGMRLVL